MRFSVLTSSRGQAIPANDCMDAIGRATQDTKAEAGSIWQRTLAAKAREGARA